MNAKRTAEKAWLSKAIKQLYTRINKLTAETYYIQQDLSYLFHHMEYINILQKVDTTTEIAMCKKRKIIKNKLQKLKTAKHLQQTRAAPIVINNTNMFYKRVDNLTDIEFNSNEMSVLNLGLKHNNAAKNNNSSITKHYLEIENAILKTDKVHQNEIRTLIINDISKQRTTPARSVIPSISNTKILRDIKEKLHENNALVTKADKGNTVVVMYNSDYNLKIKDYIDNNNILKLRNDPTNSYLKDINAAINKSTNILNKHQIYFNKMIKPSAPAITGLPKIHKQDTPIRPLINFTTSPSFKIAKHLNNWLNTHIQFPHNYSVSNNIELIDKIQSIHIPSGAKLASFDVTSMYSNIPVAETIEITSNLLTQNNIENKIVTEVINLLNVITKQNYFQHQNEFYTQPDGLPMGSPLSGTLANIYLNYIERSHILNSKNRLCTNIIYWQRYVDDILLLFKGTVRQLNQLHQYINSIHPNIKFTLEIESHNKINFLDLTIKNIDHKHIFSIYRKPTQTDHTIHITSQHPYQQKIAAYHHMLHRLNNIPMVDSDYQDELNTIKYIAYNNGYSEYLINNINSKIISKMRLHNLSTLRNDVNTNKKFISVEYNETTSNIMKKILHQYGYTAAFKTSNKTQNLLKGNRCIEPKECGVYKLTCDNCEKFYIGQTGRSFAIRFKEHIDELKQPQVNNFKSNYAEHLVMENHNYTNLNTNLQVLHRMEKSSMMDRIEELAIYQHRRNPLLLNDKINTNTNRLFDLIITNNNRLSSI